MLVCACRGKSDGIVFHYVGFGVLLGGFGLAVDLVFFSVPPLVKTYVQQIGTLGLLGYAAMTLTSSY